MGFPVQWGRPAPRVHRLHFVKCPPNRTIYMLACPEEHVTIRLHWLDQENESAPCRGDDCPLIGLTRHFDCTYTCCLQFAVREGRWMPAILCIGDPGHTLANTDFVGQKIVVGKAKEGEGGRLVYLGEDRIVTVPVPHIAKAFDVRPNLLQRWGFIREANALLDVQEGVETNSFKLDQERAG